MRAMGYCQDPLLEKAQHLTQSYITQTSVCTAKLDQQPRSEGKEHPGPVREVIVPRCGIVLRKAKDPIYHQRMNVRVFEIEDQTLQASKNRSKPDSVPVYINHIAGCRDAQSVDNLQVYSIIGIPATLSISK